MTVDSGVGLMSLINIFIVTGRPVNYFKQMGFMFYSFFLKYWNFVEVQGNERRKQNGTNFTSVEIALLFFALSKNCEKLLLDSCSPSVLPSAWNNPAPIRSILTKFDF